MFIKKENWNKTLILDRFFSVTLYVFGSFFFYLDFFSYILFNHCVRSRVSVGLANWKSEKDIFGVASWHSARLDMQTRHGTEAGFLHTFHSKMHMLSGPYSPWKFKDQIW